MNALDLAVITLTRNPNPTRTSRVCLPEAVAWFAEEEHSDQPSCVSTVLLRTGTALCARLPHAKRQGLKRFVPALVDTADDGCDEERSVLAMDWLVRVYVPAWLRLIPRLELAAASLAEHAPVLTASDATEAMAGPRAAVRRALYSLYRSDRWLRHRSERAELTLALSRRLSGSAGDAAVAGTTAIARDFLPECGRLRLTIEQALLIAAGTRATHGKGARPACELLDDVLDGPTAAIEDAAIELFSRMIDVCSPEGEGWLAADPAEAARRVGET